MLSSPDGGGIFVGIAGLGEELEIILDSTFSGRSVRAEKRAEIVHFTRLRVSHPPPRDGASWPHHFESTISRRRRRGGNDDLVMG